MDIKKAITWTGFVLAVYAVIPGFQHGSRYFYEKFATLSPDWVEYSRDPKAWRENERKRVKEARKRIRDLKQSNVPIDSRTLSAAFPKKVPPDKFQYPPDPYPIAGGILFSFLYFGAIYFGIRWITHLVFRAINDPEQERNKRDVKDNLW